MSSAARIPLKFKLAFFALVLVVFVAGSFSYFVRLGQKKAILANQDQMQRQTLAALQQVSKDALTISDDTHMVNYINTLQKNPIVAYAMVLDPQGMVLIASHPNDIGKVLLSDPVVARAFENHEPFTPVMQRVREGEREVVDLSIPVTTGDHNEMVNAVARIGFDKEELDKDVAVSLRKVDERIRQAFLLALILGTLGALLLAAFITHPLDILRQGARKIGEGQLDQRIDVHTRDELRELADEFNIMAVKLKELDQMKQDFVSNVTHELRSPMTSIRGYIDLLLQGVAGPVTDLQKDYLSIIKNSSVRLGRFIDNLLDVAKIEAHRLKLSPEPLSLQLLAHEMEVLFKPQLDEKSLTFRNAVGTGLPEAFVDKDKLAEVFINLVSNAIKFTPDKGEVAVDATEGPNYLEVSVQDSGVGIPPDMIGKLFNKFEQVKSDPGHARKHKGTGLGLTIAKGIVEAHGGKIWIKSPGPSGKGTAFFFTIPKLTPELKAKVMGL